MKPEQLEIARLKREVDQAEGRAGHPEKSRGLLCEGIDVKFAFIAKHRGIWPADWLCGGARCLRGGFTPAAAIAVGAMKSWTPRFGRAS